MCKVKLPIKLLLIFKLQKPNILKLIPFTLLTKRTQSQNLNITILTRIYKILKLTKNSIIAPRTILITTHKEFSTLHTLTLTLTPFCRTISSPNCLSCSCALSFLSNFLHFQTIKTVLNTYWLLFQTILHVSNTLYMIMIIS